MATLSISITGAAGNIAYALIPRLGELLLDENTTLSLRLLEVDARMQALEGVVMELEDCAFPFIEEIIYTSDPNVAFEGVDYAVLVGAMPRSKGMHRADLLKANAGIFATQGSALNAVAKRHCKTLVVGNPCNTNAYIAMQHAPDLPSSQFFAMSMLDQNRAYSQLASLLSLSINQIDDLCVWGNHSDSMFADFYHAKIDGALVPDVYGTKITQWQDQFIQNVATRGSEVIAMRGSSSAASAANAALDTLILLNDANPDYGMFSIALCSQGEYGAKPGSIVSYPCQYNNSGELEVVSNLQHNDFAKAKLEATFAEIEKEMLSLGDILG